MRLKRNKPLKERYIFRKGPWRCSCGKWVHGKPIAKFCGDVERHKKLDEEQ